MNENHLTPEARSLIALYFEGLTTLEQERKLRALLADSSVSGPEADEARAVMSFAAMSPDVIPPQRSRHPMVAAIASAAATVVLLIMLVCGLFASPEAPEYMAYIDGRPVDNHEEVISTIESDLSMLGEASENVSDEIDDNLNALSSALEEL